LAAALQASKMVNNFYEHFAASAERFSARPAVEVQRRDRLDLFTYEELRRLADQAAGALVSAGLGAGDRCALLAENDAHWLAAYLGLLRLGAVAVPLDTAYKPKQIAALLSDCRARALLTTARHLPAAVEGAEVCGTPCEVILLTQGAAGHRGLLADGEGTASAVLPSCPATPRDPAVILYTSGTTSDPKGVILTHGNLLAEMEAALAVIDLTERDSILGVLPLFHALAQVANLLAPLTVGARVVFLESVNTSELLRALAERDVTAFCCVPQFFYLIHQRVEREVAAAGWLRRRLFRYLLVANGGLRRAAGINLGPYLFGRVHKALGRRMRLLITGGSRFDPAVGRDLYCMGFDLLQAYGLTECCGGATVTRPGDRWDGSVGRPLPSVEVKVLPPESDAEGEIGDGEVAIRGPIVMQGYYNRPETNAIVLRDGWLHTGDLGVLDERGRLHITGRKKEVIVLSSGKNIYPEEIEAHYLQSPYIRELAVLGLARPGEPSAERLHAVVVPDFDVLREQKIVNAREIIRFEMETLSVQLPGHKRILSFDIWQEELPRTTTRKLKRFEIERRVRAQGRGAAEAAARPLDEEAAAWAATPEVAQALAVIAEMAKVPGPLRPEANIELDLGLDSMERVELLTHLEKLFGTAVSDEAAGRIYTVRDLVEAVRSGEKRGPTTETAGDHAWERLLKDAPEDDPVFSNLLRPRPLTALLIFGILRLCYLAARVLFRFRVSRREHLPTSGPFLLCPNHQSYLDPFLLASALPYSVMRQLFFVGASEFFTTALMRWLARLVNLVPVDPDSNLVRAMQAGAFGLRHGKVLVLFPEGERSIDGRVKKFKKGASILSTHLRVPIVPVALEGLFEVWPRGRSVQGLARVSMRFGEPIPPPPTPPSAASFSETEAAYARAAEALRAHVEQLWETLREPGAAEPAVAR